MDWDGADIKRLELKEILSSGRKWSQDGSRIVYSSERGGQWGIYLLDFTKMTEKSFCLQRALISQAIFP